MIEQWRLTDQEIEAIRLGGGDIGEAQQAKRQAYLDSGGVILNPDALTDLYEALKSFDRYLSASYPDNMKYKAYAVEQMEKALSRAEGK